MISANNLASYRLTRLGSLPGLDKLLVQRVLSNELLGLTVHGVYGLRFVPEAAGAWLSLISSDFPRFWCANCKKEISLKFINIRTTGAQVVTNFKVFDRELSDSESQWLAAGERPFQRKQSFRLQQVVRVLVERNSTTNCITSDEIFMKITFI